MACPLSFVAAAAVALAADLLLLRAEPFVAGESFYKLR
jgi:hypothetical protein